MKGNVTTPHTLKLVGRILKGYTMLKKIGILVFVMLMFASAQQSPNTLKMITTPGNLVSIVEGIEPSNGWQRVRPYQIGIIQSASGEGDETQIVVDFPEQEGFLAMPRELRPVLGVDMIVQPGPDWSDGNLHGGSLGSVKDIDVRGNLTLVKVQWENGFSNRYFWHEDDYQIMATALGNHPNNISDPPVFVSSMSFTEQLVLAELSTQVLQANGIEAVRLPPLDGTVETRNALEVGEIDLYSEYNGTGLYNFFRARGVNNLDKGITNNTNLSTLVVSALDLYVSDIHWTCITPGNNTYALAVRADWAAENDIYSAQDLADYINEGNIVKVASGNEFLRRPDGMATFEETYDFVFQEFVEWDIEQANYESAVAVRDGESDVGVVYATDGTIQSFGLIVLTDDAGAQPVYNIAPTIRGDVLQRYPRIPEVLCPVYETLDNFALSSLNGQVSIEGIDEAIVVRDYLCELTNSSFDLASVWFANDDDAKAWKDSCAVDTTSGE